MTPRRTKAIILRRTNYGEADKILQLLTPAGRVGAIAKGVRKGKSKLAGGLELFAICDVTLIEGRGELQIVGSAQISEFFNHVLSDYDRLQLGYTCIKEVTKASEQVSEPEFFSLLEESFRCLHDLTIQRELIEIWFNLQLLILLGVSLNVRTDINGMKLVEDSQYNFNQQEMAFEHNKSGRFSSEHIKLLRLLTVKSPKVVQNVSGVENLFEDCLWLVRALS